MKSLLVLLAMLLTACQTFGRVETPPPKSFEVDTNVIQVVGLMNEHLMEVPLAELAAAPAGSTVRLYIFSAGGDIRVADKFLTAMEGKTTICMAHVAAGGAFTIFQACTVRLVSDKSAIGTTRFQVGPTGNEAEDKKNAELAAELSEKHAALEAERLDLGEAVYASMLTLGFLWGTPQEVLAHQGADAKVDFGCSADSYKKTMVRFLRGYVDGEDGKPRFLEIKFVMTVCPVLRKLISPPAEAAIGDLIGIPLITPDEERAL